MIVAQLPLFIRNFAYWIVLHHELYIDYLARFISNFVQIPDIRTGDDVIDAVVVDEEAIGSKGCGRGAKILYGKGALDRYLSEHKNDSEVRNV